MARSGEEAARNAKNSSFFVVHDWMVKELKLKGNELLIYAVIYGFSKDGKKRCTASIQHMADLINSTKQGVQKNLNSLIIKGLIAKEKKGSAGKAVCEYYATELHRGIQHSCTDTIQHSCIGGKQSCIGVCNTVTHRSKQSLPNNIDDNIEDSIYNNKNNSPTGAPSITKIFSFFFKELKYNNFNAAREFRDYCEAGSWECLPDWQEAARQWLSEHGGQ